jgi:hypothetical protein
LAITRIGSALAAHTGAREAMGAHQDLTCGFCVAGDPCRACTAPGCVSTSTANPQNRHAGVALSNLHPHVHLVGADQRHACLADGVAQFNERMEVRARSFELVLGDRKGVQSTSGYGIRDGTSTPLNDRVPVTRWNARVLVSPCLSLTAKWRPFIPRSSESL